MSAFYKGDHRTLPDQPDPATMTAAIDEAGYEVQP